MKVQIVTNLFPPYFIGGYELACQELRDYLKSKGHEVHVLTSSWGAPSSLKETDVKRILSVRLWYQPVVRGYRKWFSDFLNVWKLHKTLNETKPDVLAVFSLAGLGGMLVRAIDQLAVPVVHEIGDTSLTREYLKLPPFFKPKILKLEHSYFRSRYLKKYFQEKGFEVSKSELIHYSVPSFEKRLPSAGVRGILYLGRLSPEKGVHVFLQALEQIKDHSSLKGVPITVAGGAVEKPYEASLLKRAEAVKGFLDIRFTGAVDRKASIEILRQHDILIFPSTWDEPFGLVLLEAAANGLAIISTATGGAGEITQNEVNALHVPKDDAGALGRTILRLMEDGGLRSRLMEAAVKRAEEFSLEQALKKIELRLSMAARA